MTTYFYKENKRVTLTPEKREAICSDIKGMLKCWYKDLDPSKKETADILKKLFPDTSDSKIDKVPDLYEQHQTYMAALQRACYPDYGAIVDVEGLDLSSNALASTYKASLIYDWYNIDLLKEIDKANFDWSIKGEAAFYVQWKQEVYQKTTDVVNEYVDEATGEVVRETIKVREDVPVYECVDVKEIDPHSLYFDKSQVDDWDNCRKIYRDFVPLEQILANQNYNLTNDEKKALKELVRTNKEDKENNPLTLKMDEKTVVYGNTVEVLEFEGTYTMPDGETLRRMEATVIAGRYLSQFKESDKPQSPYVWDAYLKRPDTGRGQSPLLIPAVLNDVENMVMDLMMRCYLLVANPPFLTPKGMLAPNFKVEGGKPIEYDHYIAEGHVPQKLDFSGGFNGYNLLNFTRNKIENATGITQYMQGSQDGSVRTAAEASYIHSGASMRIAREAYKFSHRLLYPLVRKYALFKKVFDHRDLQVNTGNGIYAEVDEAVRSGNYKFIIGGSQSAIEREAETQKIFQLFGLPAFQSLAQILNPVDAAELLKWTMNRLNLQGTSQVVEMLDSNQQLQQLAEQMGIQPQNVPQFQQDVRQYINDNMGVIGQQYMNQLQQQMQGGTQ